MVIFQGIWIEIFQINYKNPIQKIGRCIHIMLKLIYFLDFDSSRFL